MDRDEIRRRLRQRDCEMGDHVLELACRRALFRRAWSLTCQYCGFEIRDPGRMRARWLVRRFRGRRPPGKPLMTLGGGQ